MVSDSLRRSFNKWAFGTRCRNADVARILRPYVEQGSNLLDAGCGEYGLSTFVSKSNVVGLDILRSEESSDQFTFILGSITALPFAGRSFSVAASVDVFEHLPVEVRKAAVRELVNVSKSAIVITFPSGSGARRMDEEFHKALIDRKQPIPDWVSEHLANQYPEPDEIVDEIEKVASMNGRKVRTAIYYSEALVMSKLVRWAALNSRFLYFAGNLVAGFLLPVLPEAKKHDAYRTIVLAEFHND